MLHLVFERAEHIHERRSADFIYQLLVLFDLLVVHLFSVEH